MNINVDEDMAKAILCGIDAAEFECLLEYDESSVRKVMNPLFVLFPKLKENYTEGQLEKIEGNDDIL